MRVQAGRLNCVYRENWTLWPANLAREREAPMSDQSNPWTTLSSKRFYESPYVDVEQDEVRHRAGRVHAYTALRFRVFGITGLPIDHDGCTYLIGQHRYVPTPTRGNSSGEPGPSTLIRWKRHERNC